MHSRGILAFVLAGLALGIAPAGAQGQSWVFPKPVWFLSHKLGPLLTRFEAAPSPFKLPGIFWHTLRG